MIKKSSLSILFCLTLLAGCSSMPRQGSSDVPLEGPGSSSSTHGSSISSTESYQGSGGNISTQVNEYEGMDTQNDDFVTTIPQQKIVYFQYDSSLVQEQFAKSLKRHGRYLASHPDQRIRLEGHADERGSREYNIGLGMRRTETVKRILVLAGARISQVEMTSYGEEKPAVMGHNPKAWALNRRVEVVYLP